MVVNEGGCRWVRGSVGVGRIWRVKISGESGSEWRW